MSTIRLVVNDELRNSLDFLRLAKYPILTDAELVKVAISHETIRAKKARNNPAYDDTEPTTREMMINTARVWSLDEDGDEEPFWDESKLKPVKF